MFSPVHETVLRFVAEHGEVRVQDLVAKVLRRRGDYTDLFGVAAMLHAGYIFTDSTSDSQGERKRGTLGMDTRGTAVSLCQIALPKGESSMLNGCLRESWCSFPVKVFITSQGLLKLEEIDARVASTRQKRFDYVFAVFIAILAAVAGGLATRYFGSWLVRCVAEQPEVSPKRAR
jgi:hypothetical protein